MFGDPSSDLAFISRTASGAGGAGSNQIPIGAVNSTGNPFSLETLVSRARRPFVARNFLGGKTLADNVTLYRGYPR